MVVRRRKKVTKYRGHVTHGGGHRKKRRGAGSRGGRGRAGTGKRAGHKKNYFPPLGRHGFTSRRRVLAGKARVLNVGNLTQEKVDTWVREGKATKEGNVVVIRLPAVGYGKLLGAGAVHLRLKIFAASWSGQAEEKLKAAGGEILPAAGVEA